MIRFRCWYCSRSYHREESRIGERFTCGCKSRLKVPRRSGKSCRDRTITDWLVETIVYGGTGAFLGLGLGLLTVARMPFFVRGKGYIMAGLIVTGFMAGTLFGEAGINWIGQKIRDREQA